jgi:hypothetical protein
VPSSKAFLLNANLAEISAIEQAHRIFLRKVAGPGHQLTQRRDRQTSLIHYRPNARASATRSDCRTNRILQDKIGYLLKRPVGRPPQDVHRYYASFAYRAQSWNKPRRVVAKVEWHSGELYPRVGFIVTNLARPVERVVAFYNQRGTCEQYIKEGKNAIKWRGRSYR